MTTAVVALLGLAAGAALPWFIARLPDRAPDPGEPPRTPYRTLAVTPGLAWLLGAATAAGWAALAAGVGSAFELPAYLFVAWVGVALSYIDIREHRLPDWLNYTAFVGAATILAVAALVDGGWGAYGRAWLAAAAMTIGYAVLALLRPGELGLGDVKLAASLGLILGWIGWGHVLHGAFAGFLLGGLFSIGLLVTGRATKRSHIPFGPFMLAGALGTVVWGAVLFAAYLGD
ncbi:MAG TPA: A24 family peptidase [Jiangellales bacterium]|nr:A24 family peptidase [Jiangellales bacterium]